MAVLQSGPQTSETSDGIIQNGLECAAEDFFGVSICPMNLSYRPILATDLQALIRRDLNSSKIKHTFMQ